MEGEEEFKFGSTFSRGRITFAWIQTNTNKDRFYFKKVKNFENRVSVKLGHYTMESLILAQDER